MAESADSSKITSPTCVIVLGMAGCGKTSLVTRLSTVNPAPYVINLDPACLNMPYFVNIDVRDTINYKEVMKKYQLGPNGSIVTSLNLFATKFEDVIACISKCDKQLCVIDTPGQIEVFTWSASGNIITEALAASFPTVIVYVIDVDRNTQPVTFMSNMLYACSILYKTCLPFVVVMNKIDVVRHDFALAWMRDFNVFREALDTDGGYLSNLHSSMVLVLEEFYTDLKVCGVSAATGEGIDELLSLIQSAGHEYETDYKEERRKLIERRAKMNDGALSGHDKAGNWDQDDISLRIPAKDGGESSSDSEGGEIGPEDLRDDDDSEEEKKFKQLLASQKSMLAKRAEQPAAAQKKK